MTRAGRVFCAPSPFDMRSLGQLVETILARSANMFPNCPSHHLEPPTRILLLLGASIGVYCMLCLVSWTKARYGNVLLIALWTSAPGAGGRASSILGHLSLWPPPQVPQIASGTKHNGQQKLGNRRYLGPVCPRVPGGRLARGRGWRFGTYGKGVDTETP